MDMFGDVQRWLEADSGLGALKSRHHMMTPKSVSCAKAKGLLIFQTGHNDTISNNKN